MKGRSIGDILARPSGSTCPASSPGGCWLWTSPLQGLTLAMSCSCLCWSLGLNSLLNIPQNCFFPSHTLYAFCIVVFLVHSLYLHNCLQAKMEAFPYMWIFSIAERQEFAQCTGSVIGTCLWQKNKHVQTRSPRINFFRSTPLESRTSPFMYGFLSYLTPRKVESIWQLLG